MIWKPRQAIRPYSQLSPIRSRCAQRAVAVALGPVSNERGADHLSSERELTISPLRFISVRTRSAAQSPVISSRAEMFLMLASKIDWSKVLSPRERAVALLIAGGLSNKDIARELGLSPGTIKTHVHNIFKKLGVSNRQSIIIHLGTKARGRRLRRD